MDQDSEPKLNIHYREPAQKETQSGNNTATENEDSENAPLLSPTRTLGKTIQSKIEITFGDKTSTVIYGRKQLARKNIARKAPEPRGTLKNHNGTSWKMAPPLTIHRTQSHLTQTIEEHGYKKERPNHSYTTITITSKTNINTKKIDTYGSLQITKRIQQ